MAWIRSAYQRGCSSRADTVSQPSGNNNHTRACLLRNFLPHRVNPAALSSYWPMICWKWLVLFLDFKLYIGVGNQLRAACCSQITLFLIWVVWKRQGLCYKKIHVWENTFYSNFLLFFGLFESTGISIFSSILWLQDLYKGYLILDLCQGVSLCPWTSAGDVSLWY